MKTNNPEIEYSENKIKKDIKTRFRNEGFVSKRENEKTNGLSV